MIYILQILIHVAWSWPSSLTFYALEKVQGESAWRQGSDDLKKLNKDVKNVKKVAAAAAYEALMKQIPSLLESGRNKVRI